MAKAGTIAPRSLPAEAAAVIRRSTSARADEARSSAKRRTFSSDGAHLLPQHLQDLAVERGLAGRGLVEDEDAQRPLARAQGGGGEPPRPRQLLHEGRALLDHGEREVAHGRGVGGQVVLGGLLEPAVLARGEGRGAREVERPHHVLERRAQQPRLVALGGEIVDQRDERAQDAVVHPRGRARGQRARRHARRERGATFGWWCHGEPCGSPGLWPGSRVRAPF